MTGIVGGTFVGDSLDRMVGALHAEQWYEEDRFETAGYGLAIRHHGEKDPLGHAVWSDGRAAGIVDGAISNLAELNWDVPTMFEQLLRSPERTLAALEGPFVVACVDASEDRLLIATDKIGCRPCFYTSENGPAFASELKPFIEVLDDPEVNEQGISDLLLMGHMWSDTTILSGVRSLHPATILEYRDGDISTRRYWAPDYESAAPNDEYLYRLTRSFQQAMGRTTSTLRGDVGLWLSGGLDSRIAFSELARNHAEVGQFDSLVAYTYDANPGGGINPKLAVEVADELGLPAETVPLNPDLFVPVLREAVDVTGGMVKWNTLTNLSAVFNIEGNRPDVLMEGLFGVGHMLNRRTLTESSSLVDAMYRGQASLSTDEVDTLLDVSVNPLGSLEREAHRTNESDFERAVIDAYFQNYYARYIHASNPLPRSQVGTRVAYADGEFLTELARMPPSYRMGSLPFSNDELIYGVSKPKLKMIRALDADLAKIPYERSRLAPNRPFPLHVVGFYLNAAAGKLRSHATPGGTSMCATWYRSHDGFRREIDGLIDDVCARPFVDADAVQDRRERHRRCDANEMTTFGSLTTLEIWLQRNLD